PPDQRDLPSFPTRRSSDLGRPASHTIRSFGDAHRGDGRAAERRDEGRVLAWSAGHGDVKVFRRAANMEVVADRLVAGALVGVERSEEHTSELQSQSNLVCR